MLIRHSEYTGPVVLLSWLSRNIVAQEDMGLRLPGCALLGATRLEFTSRARGLLFSSSYLADTEELQLVWFTLPTLPKQGRRGHTSTSTTEDADTLDCTGSRQNAFVGTFPPKQKTKTTKSACRTPSSLIEEYTLNHNKDPKNE